MKAIFHHSEKLAANISTFWFEPDKKMHFTAGQFTELTLPHAQADDRGDKRWFTLSSSPDNYSVSITTKYAGDDKSSSFKKALFSLEPSTEVDLADAMGDFVLPKDSKRPLVFVAGGIGLTPFHSIAQWLIDQNQTRDIKFVYGVNNEEEIVFQDTFDKAGIHPTIVVGNPSAEWGGERGRISAELVLGLTQPPKDALIYVSGPEPMTEALEKDFAKAGVKKDQLVLDFFPGYQNTYSS